MKILDAKMVLAIKYLDSFLLKDLATLNNGGGGGVERLE